MDLSQKNILITGASSGIGKAIAYKCVEMGACVRLVARNRAALEQVVNDLGSEKASYYLLDMRNTDEYESVINRLVGDYGKLNGFVHSAGTQITLPLKNMTLDQYQDLFLVNTFSAFELSRVMSLKKYYTLDGLSIVFVSSVMSKVANPALVAYCASKSALVGGGRSMALELAAKKIRVNCVSPGYIEDTPMMQSIIGTISEREHNILRNGYPLGLGRSADVANICAFLLSDDSSWITGQNFVVDGGYTAR